ncbi:unnamed protein product [Parnassius apollo]|uniref:(apollo) hypothetical protein n=1 Tax=Parnassius apollo TaxID=110799 RepID=A0A8S3Y584_PARAO|nr:unnamed protein product [Parnassius apollo]
MWRNRSQEWEHQKSNLVRSLFEDLPGLPTVLETNELRSNLSDISSADGSSRSYSPLPDLIIEREKNRHDEPEEYYQLLERKMLKLYRKLFHGVEYETDSENDIYTKIIDIKDNEADSEDDISKDEHLSSKSTEVCTSKTSSNDISVLNKGAMSSDLNEIENESGSSDLNFEFLKPLFKINQSGRNNQDSTSSNFTVVVTDDSDEIEIMRRDKRDSKLLCLTPEDMMSSKESLTPVIEMDKEFLLMENITHFDDSIPVPVPDTGTASESNEIQEMTINTSLQHSENSEKSNNSPLKRGSSHSCSDIAEGLPTVSATNELRSNLSDISSADGSSRSYSPLPDLIIEREKNRHDEPEEYYQLLERKMLKLYRKLFHGVEYETDSEDDI